MDGANLSAGQGYGLGIYTVPEAAKLTGVPPRQLRRWVAGYGDEGKPPLWHPLWKPVDGQVTLGFLDLLQARFVRSMADAGLATRTIRRTLDLAKDLLGTEHPFTRAGFRTDGRRVFLAVEREGEDRRLLDILRRQYALERLIERSLKDLDFEAGIADRWWLLGRGHALVIEPSRGFGLPIDHASGVPAWILANAAKVEGSVARAARAYDVSPRAVRDALAFQAAQAA